MTLAHLFAEHFPVALVGYGFAKGFCIKYAMGRFAGYFPGKAHSRLIWVNRR